MKNVGRRVFYQISYIQQTAIDALVVDVNAKSIINFKVSFFMQTSLGCSGLVWKNPVKRSETLRFLPTEIPSIGSC